MTDEIKEMELKRLYEIERLRFFKEREETQLLTSLEIIEDRYNQSKEKELSTVDKRKRAALEYAMKDENFAEYSKTIVTIVHDIAVLGIVIDAAKRAFVMQYGSV